MHDLSLAMRFCDRLVLMNEGAVMHQGAPADVLALGPLGESYGVHGHYGSYEDEGYVVPWRRLKRGDVREQG
jgi:iron complex transport system ATP-binding protein